MVVENIIQVCQQNIAEDNKDAIIAEFQQLYADSAI